MPTTTNTTAENKSKGQVAFVEFKLPAIEAGEYTLSVKQYIANSDQPVLSDPDSTAEPLEDTLLDQFEISNSFAVRGERFSLSPADIQSVFPPENTTGEYFNVLPHIVINKPTLPWQRSVLHNNFNVNQPDSITGWLAVLVFDQFDPEPKVIQGQISDLYLKTDNNPEGNLPQGTVSYSFLPALDYGEKPTDPVQYIDVPIELFNAICPTITDIRWLTHVRKINTSNKSESQQKSSVNNETDVATVVSNRLPVMGRSSITHLVSLEKMEPYLPDNKGTQNAGIPSGTTHVRLVTLKNWSYNCMKESKNFSTYLKELDTGPFQLPEENAANPIKNTINMGYTAINHQLREGGKTVSWYHSPLVPFSKKTASYKMYNSVDAAYRYNPQSGMFDVSYAVAWQLGKMESLSKPEISGAIHHWKKGKLYDLIQQSELDFIAGHLYDLSMTSINDKEAKNQAITDKLTDTSRKILSSMVKQPDNEIKLPKAPEIPSN